MKTNKGLDCEIDYTVGLTKREEILVCGAEKSGFSCDKQTFSIQIK
jgi:hypothetical protein